MAFEIPDDLPVGVDKYSYKGGGGGPPGTSPTGGIGGLLGAGAFGGPFGSMGYSPMGHNVYLMRRRLMGGGAGPTAAASAGFAARPVNAPPSSARPAGSPFGPQSAFGDRFGVGGSGGLLDRARQSQPQGQTSRGMPSMYDVDLARLVEALGSGGVDLSRGWTSRLAQLLLSGQRVPGTIFSPEGDAGMNEVARQNAARASDAMMRRAATYANALGLDQGQRSYAGLQSMLNAQGAAARAQTDQSNRNVEQFNNLLRALLSGEMEAGYGRIAREHQGEWQNRINSGQQGSGWPDLLGRIAGAGMGAFIP